MKTYVIGDTHGCYHTFLKLLESIPMDLCCDRLVMTGDYIDRGPNSYGVLKKIQELQKRYGRDHVVLLRGNHEQMAIDAYEDGRNYWSNGCSMTLRSFEKNHLAFSEAVDFFKTLPLFYEDEHFIYVHGGIRPGVDLNAQKADDLLWIRNEFIFSDLGIEKSVIFGHTPTLSLNGDVKPLHFDHKIGIDTGCVFGGNLTALEIIDGVITQVHAVRSLAA